MLSQYPIVIERTVKWGEMDAYQHVNNTVYFRHFECGRIAYFEAMKILNDVRQGPILAATSCQFRAPLTYPDSIQIGVTAGGIEADRFTMRTVIASKKQGVIAAKGEGVVVSYDYQHKRKIPLPPSWAEAIAEIEARVG